jgi:hypothetical protein
MAAKISKELRATITQILVDSRAALEESKRISRETKTGSKARFDLTRSKGRADGVRATLVTLYGEELVAGIEHDLDFPAIEIKETTPVEPESTETAA